MTQTKAIYFIGDKRGRNREREREAQKKTPLESVLTDLHPPAMSPLQKFPQLPKIISPTGDQTFKTQA
jgi:hypothetical protein